MTNLMPEDLTALERTYLGVLALGMVSAEQARETRFRMEYVCAVCHARMERVPEGELLSDEQHTATPAFREALRAAMIDLDQKRVIGIGPPQDLAILKPSPEAIDAAYGNVDVNRHPPIFDRYLAQRCMELLMEQPAVHSFLMQMYADSGEIWHELYKQGYGQYR